MTEFYYIYILECSNGAFYTGYTTNIVRRYREHQQGTVKCKYTRSFPPIKLSACWQIYTSISAILKVERFIKDLKRTEKNYLINRPMQLSSLIATNLNLDIKIRVDALTNSA